MMQRWGTHQAPWNKDFKKKQYEMLRQNLDVDTVIVGAGITGLVTAYLLKEQDKLRRVAVLTDGEVGKGTTGNSTGHLTQVLDHDFKDLISRFGENATQAAINASGEAINLIEKVVAEKKIDCGFVRVSGFKYAESAEPSHLEEEVKFAKKFGIDAQRPGYNPLPFPVAWAVEFRNQAMFDPLRFVTGLAEKFVEAGGLLFENSRVLQVNDEELTSSVHTQFGSVKAKEIVLASHTPVGIYLSLHTRVAPYFSYVMGVRLNKIPVQGLFWDTSTPYFYFRPLELDSDLWIIGGRDHKTGQESSTLERYLELEDFIRQHLDVKEVLFYWGNEFYEPVDGLPYIGKIPFTKSVLTGTGYGGTGLTFGALAGMILSDSILGQKNKYADIFDPSRVKPIASVTSFLKENINVAKWMMSDRLTHHEISEIKLIAPNEGRVVDAQGKKLAIFRNENGRIHALSSTCTHMGGTVHWNTAEKTWDCPCHGGRYRATGEAFEGPVFEDLEDVQLHMEENPDGNGILVETASAPGFSPMPGNLIDI